MTFDLSAVAVSADDPDCFADADDLARELGLPRCSPTCTDFTYALIFSAATQPARLEIRATGPGATGPVYVDFTSGALGFRARHGSRNKESLARAVGLKGIVLPSVLDATAGLGRDAFILACLGCRVRMAERSPLIAALLRDGLKRAAYLAATRDAVQRLHLQVDDADTVMAGLADHERPDVVYLDPMYPQRGKSALVKKEMRLLRALVGDDLDAPRLLATALRVARRRVVVKRPRLAATLPGIAPSHSMNGSTTRFDIYLCAQSGHDK